MAKALSRKHLNREHLRSAITGPLGIVIMQSNKKDTKPLSQMVERYTKNGFALRLVDVVYIPAIPFPVRSTHSDYGGEIQPKWKQEGESKLNKSGRAKRRHFCSVLIRLPAST